MIFVFFGQSKAIYTICRGRKKEENLIKTSVIKGVSARNSINENDRWSAIVVAVRMKNVIVGGGDVFGFIISFVNAVVLCKAGICFGIYCF